MDWRHEATCRSEDPELFFPVSEIGQGAIQVDEAKLVCSACKVRAQCLEWALSSGSDYGVWGGLSESERKALRKEGAIAIHAAVDAARDQQQVVDDAETKVHSSA